MPLPNRCGSFSPASVSAGYIARDNPAAAFAVVARIHSVIYDTLDLMPRSGHAAHGAHEFAVPHLPYVIVYKQTHDDLEALPR